MGVQQIWRTCTADESAISNRPRTSGAYVVWLVLRRVARI